MHYLARLRAPVLRRACDTPRHIASVREIDAIEFIKSSHVSIGSSRKLEFIKECITEKRFSDAGTHFDWNYKRILVFSSQRTVDEFSFLRPTRNGEILLIPALPEKRIMSNDRDAIAFRTRCINFKYRLHYQRPSLPTLVSVLTRCPEVKRAVYHSRRD